MDKKTLELAEGYRRSRRNSSIVCGISIAWAASQFELKSITLGGNVGSIDISGASIPLVLAFVVIYTLIRFSFEYMMQSNEVRRWKLAQYDYKLTLELCRISLLLLSATGLARSLSTSIILIACIPFFFFLYGLLTFIIMLLITGPIVFGLGALRKRTSVASMAIEAGTYALIIGGILIIIFISFGVGKVINLDPIRTTFSLSTDIVPVMVFIITAIIVSVSYFLGWKVARIIFAWVPRKIGIQEVQSDGSVVHTIKDNPEHPDYTPESEGCPLVYRKVTEGEFKANKYN